MSQAGIVSDETATYTRDVNHSVSVGEWCRKNDVILELVPFEFRSYDPIEFLVDARERIEEKPKTKATFRTPTLTDDIDYPRIRASSAITLLRLLGCWEFCETSRFPDGTHKQRWVSPNYVHEADGTPSIADPNERLEELRRAASIGVLELTDLAKRFGSSEAAVNKFCEWRGISWSEWRTWGKRRLSRSLKVVYEWTTKSIADIAEAFAMPPRTLYSWIYEHYAPDFDVPMDPSREPWFISHYSKDDLGVQIPSCLDKAPSQREVYKALCQLDGDEFYVREIADAVDLSTKATQDAVHQLRGRGLVETRKGEGRWNLYRIAENGGVDS